MGDWETWKDRPLEPQDPAVVVHPFSGKALELITVREVVPGSVYADETPHPFNPAVLVHREVWSKWRDRAIESVKRRTATNDRRAVAL